MPAREITIGDRTLKNITARRTFATRCLLVWAALCLSGCVLIYAEQLRRQYWQYDSEFSALFDRINTVLTQNESLLPVLKGDESIERLRGKFPQIQALENTPPRADSAARVEMLTAHSYWLYNPYRRIRVQIQLGPLLAPSPHLTDISMALGEPPAAASAFWRWSRGFNNHYQPFTLQASAAPAWFAVPLRPYGYLLAAAAAVVALGGQLLWLRRQQRGERQRADYYQHARLNTLGEISASVVHEINQPLTAAQMWIQGAVRQLKRDCPAEAERALASALAQTQRISELLTRFRAQLGQEKIALVRVTLAESWQRVVNLLEYEAMPGKITLSHDFAAAKVLADRLWLEQVLHNLLSNAIQSQQAAGGGWVHIASRAEGDRVQVTVTDGGPGFSDEALRNALMPLYSERRGGLGLGLTLTESLMTRMNGAVKLANHPQGGGEVRLTFTTQEAQ